MCTNAWIKHVWYKYTPVIKIDNEGLLDSDVHTYIDSQRICSVSKLKYWNTLQRLGLLVPFFNIQTIPRKRCPIGLDNGVWKGTINHIGKWDGSHVDFSRKVKLRCSSPLVWIS